MEDINYYEVLGVSVHASPEEINAAKIAMAKRYHPDANMKDGIDTTEQMRLVLEAYQTLSDPAARREYDRALAGERKVTTYDLQSEDANAAEPEFVTGWKAAGALYDVITESDVLMHERRHKSRLARLAKDALHHILVLRRLEIPERYWHPDTMNWLLFTWYQNRNYTPAYLTALYDEHVRNDCGRLERVRLKNKAGRYERSIRKLLKY